MTELTATTNDNLDYATGLTAYNKDGLELFIHSDGSVHSSQAAMARMLGVAESTLRGVLSNREFEGVTPIQTQTNVGGKQSRLYPVKTLVVLASKYNPELLSRFAEMGANVYLYQLAGYKVGVQVEPPKTTELSKLELAELMQQYLNEEVERLTYLVDKPGLASKMAVAHDGDTKALEVAKVDFNGLCELAGVTISSLGEKCRISSALSHALMNDTMEPTEKRSVTTKDSKGRYQSRKLCFYPVSAVATLKNVAGL